MIGKAKIIGKTTWNASLAVLMVGALMASGSASLSMVGSQTVDLQSYTDPCLDELGYGSTPQDSGGPCEGIIPAPVGLSGSLDGPEYVFAGHPFHVLGEISLDALGASLVNIQPVAPPSGSVCSLTSYSISGGYETADNNFLMVNTGEPLIPSINGDPAFGLDTVIVDLKFDTAEDVTGDCNVGVVADEVLSLKEPLKLGRLIPVVELPPTPILLGHVKTVGGHTIPDQASVVVPAAPPDVYVTVVTSNPKIAATGTISHDDGPDWRDKGHFQIRKNGGSIKSQSLAEPTSGELIEAETALPHEAGETVSTEFCLYGVYVDGGMWTDYEGPAETCLTVHAIEPDPGAIFDEMEALCAAFIHSETQADLLNGDQVLAPVSRGLDVAPSPLVLDGFGPILLGDLQAPSLNNGEYYLFDDAFGETWGCESLGENFQ